MCFLSTHICRQNVVLTQFFNSVSDKIFYNEQKKSPEKSGGCKKRISFHILRTRLNCYVDGDMEFQSVLHHFAITTDTMNYLWWLVWPTNFDQIYLFCVCICVRRSPIFTSLKCAKCPNTISIQITFRSVTFYCTYACAFIRSLLPSTRKK